MIRIEIWSIKVWGHVHWRWCIDFPMFSMDLSFGSTRDIIHTLIFNLITLKELKCIFWTIVIIEWVSIICIYLLVKTTRSLLSLEGTFYYILWLLNTSNRNIRNRESQTSIFLKLTLCFLCQHLWSRITLLHQME